MHKKTWMTGAILVLAMAMCMNAYAAASGDSGAGWQGFWNSVGGFLYNALPWNWGNWMGK